MNELQNFQHEETAKGGEFDNTRYQTLKDNKCEPELMTMGEP